MNFRHFTKTNKCIVKINPKYFRPSEVETLLGDASKAKLKLGWTPKIKFHELVAEMTRADLASAQSINITKNVEHKNI